MVGSLAEKKLPTEESSEINGERRKVRGRIYQITDNIKITGLYCPYAWGRGLSYTPQIEFEELIP